MINIILADLLQTEWTSSLHIPLANFVISKSWPHKYLRGKTVSGLLEWLDAGAFAGEERVPERHIPSVWGVARARQQARAPTLQQGRVRVLPLLQWC